MAAEFDLPLRPRSSNRQPLRPPVGSCHPRFASGSKTRPNRSRRAVTRAATSASSAPARAHAVTCTSTSGRATCRRPGRATGAATAAARAARRTAPGADQPVRPASSQPPGIRSPLTSIARPSYAPTNYVAPGSRPPGEPLVPAPALPSVLARRRARCRARRTFAGKHQEQRDRLAQMPVRSLPARRRSRKLITLAEGMTREGPRRQARGRASRTSCKKLIEKRLMLTINSTLDTDTATMIAREFGAEIEMRSFEEEIVEAETDEGAAGGQGDARARRHGDGSRRPWQDDAPRRHPRDACRRA